MKAGQTVYLIQCNINGNHLEGKTLGSRVVESIGRKYVNLQNGMRFDVGGCFSTWGGSFWKLFETEQDYLDDVEKLRIVNILGNKFPYTSSFQKLPLSALKQIEEIVREHLGD